jgi:hypothetical protein
MPVDPLEEARERLGRVASGINWGFVYCRSDGIHLWQADLTAILAELDRRSPPTREGAAEVAGLLRKTWHDFRYPPRGTPPGPEDADVFDAMAAALAAAPPPPDESRGLDREEVARLAYFMACEGEMSEQDARSPLNDGHWAHWKVHPDYQCCFRLADAIIALSAPAGGGVASPLRPAGAPEASQ